MVVIDDSKMKPLEVEQIHRRIQVDIGNGFGSVCASCRESYPCETRVALAILQEKIDEITKELERFGA